jgi:hypothetical protein
MNGSNRNPTASDNFRIRGGAVNILVTGRRGHYIADMPRHRAAGGGNIGPFTRLGTCYHDTEYTCQKMLLTHETIPFCKTVK